MLCFAIPCYLPFVHADTWSYAGQWGSLGTGNGQFDNPWGIAINATGDIYVTDYSNNRVQIFSSGGSYIGQWGTYGRGNGQFDGPMGIAIAPNGNVYVADRGNSRIEEFSSIGSYITQFGITVPYPDYNWWTNPNGVAIDNSGNVYVSYPYMGCAVFSSDGTLLTSWAAIFGNHNGPSSIAIYDGNVFFTFGIIDQIAEYSTSGTLLTEWNTFDGNGQAGVDLPLSIAVDASGSSGPTVYTLDGVSGNFVAEEYTAQGTFLGQWGSTGSGDGQLEAPSGIAVDTINGAIYIADSGNNRIEVFESSIVFAAPETPWGTTINAMFGALGIFLAIKWVSTKVKFHR